MNHELLRTELVRDEGVRLKPYRDTVGKLTIGVGRNLDDNGIRHVEAIVLLDNDIAAAERDLRLNLLAYDGLPECAQRGLVNMVFNLGWPRFASFKKMISALERQDFAAAAAEALDSKWARQVGERAKRIASLIEQGTNE